MSWGRHLSARLGASQEVDLLDDFKDIFIWDDFSKVFTEEALRWGEDAGHASTRGCGGMLSRLMSSPPEEEQTSCHPSGCVRRLDEGG